MTEPGVLTYKEIGSQDHALAEAWNQLDKQKEWVTRYLRNPQYSEVVFIGSGSSY